jgi:GNAT superfamily N-acetyltransferase
VPVPVDRRRRRQPRPGSIVDSQADGPVPVNEPIRGVRVTRMVPSDLPDVARLHLQALPDSFFASLGPRFLRRYHESYLASPSGVTLVATADGQLCGFVVGSSAAEQHSAWVVRHRGIRLAVTGLVAMLLRPLLLTRFLSTRASRYVRGLQRRLPNHVSTSTAASEAASPAVLAHVAVHRAWRRIGLGDRLVRAFEDEVRDEGARTVELVTLDGPEGAGPFYERMGYAFMRSRQDEDGRRWLYFRSALRKR